MYDIPIYNSDPNRSFKIVAEITKIMDLCGFSYRTQVNSGSSIYPGGRIRFSHLRLSADSLRARNRQAEYYFNHSYIWLDRLMLRLLTKGWRGKQLFEREPQSVNVRCCNSMHRIYVNKKGRLILASHPKCHLEEDLAMHALADSGKRLPRCLEILEAWTTKKYRYNGYMTAEGVVAMPQKLRFAYKTGVYIKKLRDNIKKYEKLVSDRNKHFLQQQIMASQLRYSRHDFV